MAVAVRDVETAPARLSAAGTAHIPTALQRLLPSLHEALRSTAVPANTKLGAMSSYHLGWTDADGQSSGDGGGKFLRGCLSLWAAEQCAGHIGDALPVAAAVE